MVFLLGEDYRLAGAGEWLGWACPAVLYVGLCLWLAARTETTAVALARDVFVQTFGGWFIALMTYTLGNQPRVLDWLGVQANHWKCYSCVPLWEMAIRSAVVGLLAGCIAAALSPLFWLLMGRRRAAAEPGVAADTRP